ncbi:MAG: hypothetical protein HN341_10790 [Verrucomicrobia bacterium]|nr:hypothetical protein [Verrucomicrobiota bacterium]
MKTGLRQFAPLLVFLFAGALTHTRAHGEPAAPSTPSGPEAPPAKLDALRDPFWPVGYTPTPKSVLQAVEQASRIQEQAKWPKLTLRGISRTGKDSFMAIVEGIGIVESGDVVSMTHDGLVYSWRINTVNENGISRTRLNVRTPISTLQKPER